MIWIFTSTGNVCEPPLCTFLNLLVFPSAWTPAPRFTGQPLFFPAPACWWVAVGSTLVSSMIIPLPTLQIQVRFFSTSHPTHLLCPGEAKFSWVLSRYLLWFLTHASAKFVQFLDFFIIGFVLFWADLDVKLKPFFGFLKASQQKPNPFLGREDQLEALE